MINHEWITVITFLSFLTVLPIISGQGPLNAAVDVGTPRTYLNCSDSRVPSNQFTWTKNIKGTLLNVATGCISSNSQLYEMDSSTPNSCNLIILNALPSHAGEYMCTPGSQSSLSALFFVMETKAVCSSRGNKMNGYTFFCSASFRRPDVNTIPISTGIGWTTRPEVNFLPQSDYLYSHDYGTYYLTMFSIKITPGVTMYAVPPNLCQVNFKYLFNSPTGLATNIPPYESHCSVTELTENKELTYITMSRNVGFLAGGTKIIITLTSQGVVDDVRNVYFGDYNPQKTIKSVQRINMSCLILNVYSPPASTKTKVNITIENSFAAAESDWYLWTAPNAYFEYKANPTITKLYPTTHLTSGGTRITIEGTNLDAAESPRLQMNITIYRNNSQNSVENINVTSADCFGIIHDTDPAYSKNKRLLCRMPMLDLPRDFLKNLEETVRNADNLSTKRRKRSVNGDFEVARFTNKLGEVAVAELSLAMDDLEPLPIESFTVDFIPTSLITFNKSEDVVKIKSGNPETIEMRGSYINKIGTDNFVIRVGSDNCTIQSKQDNVILYLPPKHKPSRRSVNNDIYCNGDLLDIRVSINQERHNDTQWVCGCAEYYNFFPLLLVVLVTVLGGILIIIISMVLIFLCCTKCRNSSSAPNNATELATLSVTLRNKSPNRTDKSDFNHEYGPNGDGLNNNYHRKIPDDAISDDSIKYRGNVNNYNRNIPSIYP